MSSFHSRHRQVGGRSFHLDRNKTDLLHACLPAMPLWHTAFNTCEPEHLTASTRSSASWSFLLPHPPPWTARAHPGFATMGFPLPRLALIAICVNAHRDTAAPATAPQNCKNVKKQAVLSVWPPWPFMLQHGDGSVTAENHQVTASVSAVVQRLHNRSLLLSKCDTHTE